jgi:hypothetical protein
MMRLSITPTMLYTNTTNNRTKKIGNLATSIKFMNREA